MKFNSGKVALGLLALCLLACGDVDTHVYPVTITADPTSIYTGDTTRLTWSAPGGMQVLSSNFGAQTVSGWTDVSPSSSTEYKIKIRLASNDIYTAKVSVTVSDPPDEGGEEESLQASKRKP